MQSEIVKDYSLDIGLDLDYEKTLSMTKHEFRILLFYISSSLSSLGLMDKPTHASIDLMYAELLLYIYRNRISTVIIKDEEQNLENNNMNHIKKNDMDGTIESNSLAGKRTCKSRDTDKSIKDHIETLSSQRLSLKEISSISCENFLKWWVNCPSSFGYIIKRYFHSMKKIDIKYPIRILDI